jgi:hypothetical protein
VGKLWNARTYEEISDFQNLSKEQTSVTFDGTSTSLATIGVGRDVRVFILTNDGLRAAAARLVAGSFPLL